MFFNWLAVSFTLFAALSVAWYALGMRAAAWGGNATNGPLTMLLRGISSRQASRALWSAVVLLAGPLAGALLMATIGALPSLLVGLTCLGVAVLLKLSRREPARAGGNSKTAPGAALQALAKSGQYDRIIDRLRETLPDWPVRVVLIEATTELAELNKSARIARAAGVSPSLTDGIVEEARRAFDAIWPSVDRIAAVAAQGVQTPNLQARIDRETEKLKQLSAATRVAREGLAVATLSGGSVGDIESAEMGLRMLGEAAHELS